MRLVLIPVYCLLYFCTVHGQEVVMDKSVSKDMFKMNNGPNTGRFTHLFLSLGSFIKTSEGQADLKIPASLQFAVGLRTKYKLTEWYSLGYELEYRLTDFRYNKAHDSLPYHETDKILTHSLAFSLFQRFNFDKRGNYIGKFLDMGAYVEYPFSKSNILIDNIDTLASGKQKLILSKLKFMNSFNYGLTAKIGYNRIVLFAMYRLSEIFKSNSGRMDLPKLSVGLQVGIHK